MKKIFTLFAVAAMLLMVGCKPKPVSILNQSKADYAEVVAEMPDSLVAFYEVEMVLDKPISELNHGQEVGLLSAVTVIQMSDSVKFIAREYDKKNQVASCEVEKEKGFWLGDFNMPLDSLNLDFADAIQRLKETDIVLPEADKVTLRKPAAPPFRTYYIFGTKGTFFIDVDAITGEVSEYQAPEDDFVGIKINEEVAE